MIKTRTRFYRSLRDLNPARDHPVLFELAEDGSTDYLALPIIYGDGSVQGAAFTTDASGGFSQEAIALIERLSPFLAAALEPAAMRRSAESLLRTYLGDGPAQRIAAGAIRRGDQVAIEAAVLLTDLRGYTLLSEQLLPNALLERLGQYQELVVTAVRAEGGDVLKFIGDGVLAIFPVEDGGRETASTRARRALEAALLNAESDRGDALCRLLARRPCDLRQHRQPGSAGLHGRGPHGQLCQPAGGGRQEHKLGRGVFPGGRSLLSERHHPAAWNVHAARDPRRAGGLRADRTGPRASGGPRADLEIKPGTEPGT